MKIKNFRHVLLPVLLLGMMTGCSDDNNNGGNGQSGNIDRDLTGYVDANAKVDEAVPLSKKAAVKSIGELESLLPHDVKLYNRTGDSRQTLYQYGVAIVINESGNVGVYNFLHGKYIVECSYFYKWTSINTQTSNDVGVFDIRYEDQYKVYDNLGNVLAEGDITKDYGLRYDVRSQFVNGELYLIYQDLNEMVEKVFHYLKDGTTELVPMLPDNDHKDVNDDEDKSKYDDLYHSSELIDLTDYGHAGYYLYQAPTGLHIVYDSNYQQVASYVIPNNVADFMVGKSHFYQVSKTVSQEGDKYDYIGDEGAYGISLGIKMVVETYKVDILTGQTVRVDNFKYVVSGGTSFKDQGGMNTLAIIACRKIIPDNKTLDFTKHYVVNENLEILRDYTGLAATEFVKVGTGYYNETTKVLYNSECKAISNFDDLENVKYWPGKKVFTATNKFNKQGIIDSNGKIKLAFNYDRIEIDDKSTYYLAFKDNDVILGDVNKATPTSDHVWKNASHRVVYEYSDSYENKDGDKITYTNNGLWLIAETGEKAYEGTISVVNLNGVVDTIQNEKYTGYNLTNNKNDGRYLSITTRHSETKTEEDGFEKTVIVDKNYFYALGECTDKVTSHNEVVNETPNQGLTEETAFELVVNEDPEVGNKVHICNMYDNSNPEDWDGFTYTTFTLEESGLYNITNNVNYSSEIYHNEIDHTGKNVKVRESSQGQHNYLLEKGIKYFMALKSSTHQYATININPVMKAHAYTGVETVNAVIYEDEHTNEVKNVAQTIIRQVAENDMNVLIKTSASCNLYVYRLNSKNIYSNYSISSNGTFEGLTSYALPKGVYLFAFVNNTSFTLEMRNYHYNDYANYAIGSRGTLPVDADYGDIYRRKLVVPADGLYKLSKNGVETAIYNLVETNGETNLTTVSAFTTDNGNPVYELRANQHYYLEIKLTTLSSNPYYQLVPKLDNFDLELTGGIHQALVSGRQTIKFSVSTTGYYYGEGVDNYSILGLGGSSYYSINDKFMTNEGREVYKLQNGRTYVAVVKNNYSSSTTFTLSNFNPQTSIVLAENVGSLMPIDSKNKVWVVRYDITSTDTYINCSKMNEITTKIFRVDSGSQTTLVSSVQGRPDLYRLEVGTYLVAYKINTNDSAYKVGLTARGYDSYNVVNDSKNAFYHNTSYGYYKATNDLSNTRSEMKIYCNTGRTFRFTLDYDIYDGPVSVTILLGNRTLYSSRTNEKASVSDEVVSFYASQGDVITIVYEVGNLNHQAKTNSRFSYSFN